MTKQEAEALAKDMRENGDGISYADVYECANGDWGVSYRDVIKQTSGCIFTVRLFDARYEVGQCHTRS